MCASRCGRVRPRRATRVDAERIRSKAPQPRSGLRRWNREPGALTSGPHTSPRRRVRSVPRGGFEAVCRPIRARARASVPMAAFALTESSRWLRGHRLVVAKRPMAVSTLDDLAPTYMCASARVGIRWRRMSIDRARPLTGGGDGLVTVVLACSPTKRHFQAIRHFEGIESLRLQERDRSRATLVLPAEIMDGRRSPTLWCSTTSSHRLQRGGARRLAAAPSAGGRSVDDVDGALVVCSVHYDRANGARLARNMVTQYLGPKQPHLMQAS